MTDLPAGKPLVDNSARWPKPTTAWTAVALLHIAYIVSFIDRTILSLLVEPIKADLGLSDTQMALLMGAAFGLFYTTMGLPLGWLIDRARRTSVIGIAASFWCAMTALGGLAGSFAQLFLTRLGVGLGEAALSPGAASLIADYFPPQRRAAAMGVYVAGGSVGAGLALILGGTIIEFIGQGGILFPGLGVLAGWRATLLLVGFAGLIAVAPILFLPEPPRRQDASATAQASWAEFGQFMRRGRIAFGLHFAAFGLFAIAAYAVLSWAPAHLMRSFGWSAGDVGSYYGVAYLLGGSLGAVLGGYAGGWFRARGDRQGDMRAALIGLSVAGPVTMAAFLMPSAPLATLFLGLLAFAFAFPSAGSIAALQAMTPGRMRGRAAALYYLAMGVPGLLLGPLVPALISDYLLGDPNRLGEAIAIVGGILPIVASFLIWLWLRHVGQLTAPS